jgi:hypothetical protein
VSGWTCLSNPPEVKPIDDLRPHDDGMACWCEPTDDEGVIVHNSADGRELYERGERKPC